MPIFYIVETNYAAREAAEARRDELRELAKEEADAAEGAQ